LEADLQSVFIPSSIYLYEEKTAETLDLRKIADYLEGKIEGIKVRLRAPFLFHFLSSYPPERRDQTIDHLARRFAGARVKDPSKPDRSFRPMPVEIEYEKRRLKQPDFKAFGILYNGTEVQRILRDLIPRKESGLRHVHIVFTNQFIGTWDEGDLRYHARVALYGMPSVISTTGVVEAPAKPREYYLLRNQLRATGADEAAFLELKERFADRFIDHDDPRLTQILKGYVMQAVFFHMIGDPFCDDATCRLYNAHWQEEMIRAQLTSEREFCSRHQEILRKIRSKKGS